MSQSAGDWKDEEQHRAILYRLKLEIRRVERAGTGETAYAAALRRVLGALSDLDMDAVFRMLESEIRQLDDGDMDNEQAEALRQTLNLIEPQKRSRRELFLYYLRKMEQEGRGDEPFAGALRRALESPDGPSLQSLFNPGNLAGGESNEA
ncbi:MAG: hypothetical protein WD275_04610 [Rhodothermales bacterium]